MKLRIAMKALVAICIYCPLNWIIHNRHINHIKLYERALKIVYVDHFPSIEELLSKDKSVTVHDRNLQILAIEMYKILTHFSTNVPLM